MTTTQTEALKLALEALEEIALAGMSGTGQESEEGMIYWHSRQAWKFIGIAARALEPIKASLAQQSNEQVEPVAVVDANDDGYFAEILPDRSVKVGQFLFAHPPVPRGMVLVPYEPSNEMQEQGSTASGYDLSQTRAKKIYQSMIDMHLVRTSHPPVPTAQPKLQTCNCRWDGEVQVQQCTLHESHVDAVHEWAERAKTAEAKLKAQPKEPEQEPAAWMRSEGFGSPIVTEELCQRYPEYRLFFTVPLYTKENI